MIFGNALPLMLALYGLKCIVTLNGHLTEPGSREMLHTFYFAPVHRTAAVLTGLGNIALALFGYLSCGPPPPEDRLCAWRLARALLRWGSLTSTFVLWHQAHKLRLNML
jgi:hypothetical protein